MKPYYDKSGITIYAGDCLEVMPVLEPLSFGLVVTSPPYHVGMEYEKKQTDESFATLLNNFASTTSRLVDNGAFLFVNIADRLDEFDEPKKEIENGIHN